MPRRVLYNCKGRLTDAGWFFVRQEVSRGRSLRSIAKALNVAPSTVLSNKRAAKPPSERPRQPRQTAAHVTKRRRLVVKLSQVTATKLGSRGVSGRARPQKYSYNVYPSAKSIGCEARRRGAHNTSPSTIRRDLKAGGMVSRIMPAGPAHKEGDEEDRVAACTEYLALPQVDPAGKFLNVRFSDEKIADSNWHGCRRQWVQKGQRPRHRPKERYCCSVLVWIVVGVGYRHIQVMPRTNITGPVYRNKCIRPIAAELIEYCRNGGLFQDDNAKPHQSCRRGLERRGIKFLRWVPRSCDLSPVETIHEIVEQRVWARSNPPATTEELSEAWQEEFAALPRKVIDETVLRFARLCKECIRLGGRVVKMPKARQAKKSTGTRRAKRC